MEQQMDAALVAQARRGNREAFGKLIERYATMVKRIALRLVGRQEIAPELAREAFVQAYLSLDSLRNGVSFKNWLYGITLNVCRNYLRDSRIEVFSLERIEEDGHSCFALDEGSDPLSVLEEHEARQAILRAIDGLSAKDREVTLLFYYQQYSLEEIAALLHISVGTVKGRLYRARRQLRQSLSFMRDELPEALARERRKKKAMLPVTIDSVRHHSATQQYVIVLKEETGQLLYIWVAKPEASVIAGALNDVPTPRPMTAQLMVNLLQATGIQLEEVRIESLKDEVFYAVLKIRNGEKVQELDARPSDALSLAVMLKCPVYVAEEVMERCLQNNILEKWGLSEFQVLDRETLLQEQQERSARLQQVIASLGEIEAQKHKSQQQQAAQEMIERWKEERGRS
ncbi:MAG TPA: bifunctional nuclease domain-containing protein [Ktedonobacteraceae bacterium]|jgi:RNA polymerase sigma factor (sigma-70 family)|nr:bifunctional nuclease domain-containing protein [Ktedonobacteraceae bacterium]